jgi:hypothetical protein
MSLTAFNRARRIKQVEEMKPENIVAKEQKEIKVEEVKTEVQEQEEVTPRRRTRRTNA